MLYTREKIHEEPNVRRTVKGIHQYSPRGNTISVVTGNGSKVEQLHQHRQKMRVRVDPRMECEDLKKAFLFQWRIRKNVWCSTKSYSGSTSCRHCQLIILQKHITNSKLEQIIYNMSERNGIFSTYSIIAITGKIVAEIYWKQTLLKPSIVKKRYAG